MLKGLSRAHRRRESVQRSPTNIDLSAFDTKDREILRRASAVSRYLDGHRRPRAINLMDDGVPLGHSLPVAQAMVPAAPSSGRERLQQIAAPQIALAKKLEQEDPPGRALRSRRAGACFDRLLPSEGVGPSQ